MIKIIKDLKNEFTNGNISDLFDEVDAVLQKRETIQERYLRGITSTNAADDSTVQVFFEKFITDLAAGYLSGEVTYNAEIIDEDERQVFELVHKDQTPLDASTAAQLKYILTTLSAKNDDPKVLKALFHDAVLFGAAYERQLDTDTDRIHILLTTGIINSGNILNGHRRHTEAEPSSTYHGVHTRCT